MTNKLIEGLIADPRKIFIFDGFGAVVTAFMLGIVLVKFEFFFGIPSSTLYLLAVIPIFYMIYDAYAYQKSDNQIGSYLKGIATLNLMYCVVSLGFAFYHEELTIWGWIYVIGEIIIIVILSIFELKVGNRLNNSQVSPTSNPPIG